MKQKIIGKSLLILGIIIIIYAFNMHISINGSEFVNLNMLSDRQNTITIGGISFLAGIILYALEKNKEKEESNTKNKYQEKFKILKEKIINSISNAREFFIRKNEGTPSISMRLIIGIALGTLIGLFILYPIAKICNSYGFFYFNNSPGTIIAATIAITTIYAFKNNPTKIIAKSILKTLLITAVISITI